MAKPRSPAAATDLDGSLADTLDLLKRRMAERGISKADLARALGWLDRSGRPSPYIYNLLNGTQRLSRDQVARIVEVLDLGGASADDIYFVAGMLPADLDERLRSDRQFLARVRDLFNG